MKLLIFILGITIPFIALYIGLHISPVIGTIVITPITFVSTFLEQSFSKLPYFIHALLIFSTAIIYLTIFFFSFKLITKKLLNKI